MNEYEAPGDTGPRQDPLTVAAVAAAAYALASLLHEGVGHGGACLIVGGVPRVLSSMEFRCDLGGLAPTARRIVAAGGTLVQLAAGVLAYGWYQGLGSRSPRPAAPVWRYALWLFAAVNLLQGTGYFLFSGVGGIGDWAVVTAGLRPAPLWRAALAAGGCALYWATNARLFRALGPFVGAARPVRKLDARTLSLVPYAVGGALSLAAGLRNPAGLALVAISGAAASLGGTSGLVWGTQFLRGAPGPAGARAAPAGVARSWPAIALGTLAVAAFVAILGPGLHFR